MTDISRIVAGLTEAQKRALIACNPWDVEVGMGITIAFICHGFLQDSTIIDDGVELTPLGLQVRNAIKEGSNDAQ